MIHCSILQNMENVKQLYRQEFWMQSFTPEKRQFNSTQNYDKKTYIMSKFILYFSLNTVY